MLRRRLSRRHPRLLCDRRTLRARRYRRVLSRHLRALGGNDNIDLKGRDQRQRSLVLRLQRRLGRRHPRLLFDRGASGRRRRHRRIVRTSTSARREKLSSSHRARSMANGDFSSRIQRRLSRRHPRLLFHQRAARRRRHRRSLGHLPALDGKNFTCLKGQDQRQQGLLLRFRRRLGRRHPRLLLHRGAADALRSGRR